MNGLFWGLLCYQERDGYVGYNMFLWLHIIMECNLDLDLFLYIPFFVVNVS